MQIHFLQSTIPCFDDARDCVLLGGGWCRRSVFLSWWSFGRCLTCCWPQGNYLGLRPIYCFDHFVKRFLTKVARWWLFSSRHFRLNLCICYRLRHFFQWRGVAVNWTYCGQLLFLCLGRFWILYKSDNMMFHLLEPSGLSASRLDAARVLGQLLTFALATLRLVGAVTFQIWHLYQLVNHFQRRDLLL